MTRHLLPMFAIALLTGVANNDAQADDYNFPGWKVSVNSGSSQQARTVHEKVYREVHETKYVTTYDRSVGGGFGGFGYYRPYYWGGGSNFSYYFPWRNLGAGRGFTSFYRPRTIYNYGW